MHGSHGSRGLWLVAALALASSGCPEEQGSSGASTASAESPDPAASGPSQPAKAPPPPPPPAQPRDDCPKDSSGVGTFKEPCEGKGIARMMEVAWTGKIADEGPSFRVTNKSELTILYGKILVYFYDKAGKQLEVEDNTV